MNSTMIYAATQTKAENKLNELTKDILDVVSRTKDTVQTKQAIFRARKWSQSYRGYRYQEVYIDDDLKEVYGDVICKIRHPLEQRNELYNYKEHIFWF